MKIFQTSPTYVYAIEDKVYKVFKDKESCINEFNILRRSNNILLKSDDPSLYSLKLIKTESVDNKTLILQKAAGQSLMELINADNYNATGNCLARFHKLNPRVLLGDFTINHLFINQADMDIEFIDPGANFMIKGDSYEDLARFMFSVAEAFRYSPRKTILLLVHFLNGYMNFTPINKSHFKKIVKLRMLRSYQKYKMQKSFLKSRLGFFILLYNRILISIALKAFK